MTDDTIPSININIQDFKTWLGNREKQRNDGHIFLDKGIRNSF